MKSHWTTAQTGEQFRAIAWLRWRILANSFRRKGGAGELIGRLVVYFIVGGFTLIPTVLAGGTAFYFARFGRYDRLATVLWATFLLCQFLNINIGQPGTTFDPRVLIRFPMRLASFVAIRLYFGLLSPSTVLGTIMSLAVAVGVTIASPRLWAYAFAGLLIFAATNALFSRMVFAWVDRWLATRRAREILTGVTLVFSIAVQYFNLNYNPVYHSGRNVGALSRRLAVVPRVMHTLQPVIRRLPPELTASSLLAARMHQGASFATLTLGTGLFGVAFLLIFSLRMRAEFRGEILTEDAKPARERKAKSVDSGGRHAASNEAISSARPVAPGHPSIIGAVMAKELLYVRRNTGMLYSLLAPLVMVFLFAGRIASRTGTTWTFPGALSYVLLGLVPIAYNTFGTEAAGAQVYFLAPVRLRDIMLAKNLFIFSMAAIEAVGVLAAVTYLGRFPSPSLIIAAMLWAAATLLFSMSIGNRRSISSPKKIVSASAATKQTSPLSALISTAVLLVSTAVGFGIILAANLLHRPWVAVPAMAALLAAAVPTYVAGLRGLDRYALDYRDSLFTELTKS